MSGSARKGIGRIGPRQVSLGSRPRDLGIVGLVSAIVLAVAVVALSRASFGAETYHARLAQTAGLRVGESVQVAGVEVGEVRAIELRGREVDVEFTVDDAVHLGDGTEAEVRVATLLGTHYLQIVPSGDGALQDGVIPIERTTVPFNLQDVINATTEQIEQLDTDALSAALTTVAETIQASSEHVGPALRGLTRLSELIVRRGAEFEDLAEATRSVTDQLNGSSGDLLALMRDASLFLQELTDRRDDVHQLLINVRSVSQTVSGIVDDNEGRLAPLLRDLDVVNDALTSQEKAMKLAAQRLAVSARYLANATGNGPWADLYVPDSQPQLLVCATGSCS